jgi:hypothetical protein
MASLIGILLMLKRQIAVTTFLVALLALGACNAKVDSASVGNSLSESHTVTKKGTAGR